jgi:hypothetical protein
MITGAGIVGCGIITAHQLWVFKVTLFTRLLSRLHAVKVGYNITKQQLGR